jgi:deazaflavin-dependent oxidoreductase (nitroreductase family)
LEEIMANSAASEARDYNTKIIEEFRANQGRVGGIWAGTTLILIHHIGAKSGIERVLPLGCFTRDDGRFAVVASNGGSPAHPDWYYNLKANPRVMVEVGTQTFTVVAEELDDTAHKAWSDPQFATWADHRDRLARHGRLWAQDGLTYLRTQQVSWL